MKKAIRTHIGMICAIAALIAALTILAAGCGDSGVNSGGKSEYLNRFLDVFSKNPGHNDDGSYTLTIDLSPAEGGTVSRSNERSGYKAGTSITVTATPMEGYRFLGWSGALNSTNANVTITMNGDRWLSANFIKEGSGQTAYDVRFDANGATGTPPSLARAVSGNSITLPGLESMERSGYNFIGWNTNSSGTGLTYAADSSYIVTDNVTLYARWIPIYTVTFSSGYGVPAAMTVDSGTVIRLPDMYAGDNTPLIFAGWSTDAENKYSVNTQYTVINDITLYAKWDRKCQFGYNGNGNTSGYIDQVLVYEPFGRHVCGSVITLSDNMWGLAKDGYYFDGWCDNPSCTGNTYPVGSSYTINGSGVYAKWVALPTVSIPNVPSNVSATVASSSSITVSWSSVYGATGYYVYRSTSASGSYSRVGTTSSTTYTDNKLSSGTTYYYKVSAYNSVGESVQSSYGSATTTTTFTDARDRKTYKTVKIGNQIWMAENLNYDTANGVGSWCYDNSASNCNKYGRLYDKNTAMVGSASSNANPNKLRGICPSGWHLPSRQEWVTLVEIADGSGKKLTSKNGWNISCYDNDYGDTTCVSGNGTDNYGFSALPGGHGWSNGDEFYYVGREGYWWIATMEINNVLAFFSINHLNIDLIYDDSNSEPYAFSVRCVEDE